MRLFAITGWLVALAATAGAGLLWWELQSTKSSLVTAEEATAIVQEEARRLKQLSNELQAKLDIPRPVDAEMRADTSPSAATLLQGLLGGLKRDGEEKPNANPFAALMAKAGEGESGGGENPFAKQFAAMFGETEGEDGQQNPMGGIMKSMGKLMASQAGQEFMDEIVQSQVLNQYDDLFKQLHLSPEKEQQVKDIILENARGGVAEAMQMFGGDEGFDFDAMRERQHASESSLRENLAKVLNPAQMAQVDAYNEQLPVKTMSDAYEMDLRMSVPSLSPELLDSAATTIAEETFSATRDAALDEQAGLQQAAMERALARLEPQLDDEQYQQVQRWMEDQARMSEWAMGMFGNRPESEAGSVESAAELEPNPETAQ